MMSFYDKLENNASIIKVAQKHLLDKHSIRTSESSVRRWMRCMKYSRKRLSTKVLGTVSAEKVHEYLERHTALVKPDTLVVSLDECYFSEKVMPLYGYSKIGTRCALRSHGGWKMRSLILGIANDGTMHHLLKPGSVRRDDFGEFVLDMPFPPDTVILMDNCSVHKSLEGVFDAKGYIPLFLSPYSPKFQPVELAFSKVKGLFRSMWPWQ